MENLRVKIFVRQGTELLFLFFEVDQDGLQFFNGDFI
jgi:hypothetical protein